MTKLHFLVIFVSIILLGTLLRLWGLDTTPPSLNQDEAVNGVDAYALLYNARDHHGNFLPPMLQSFNDWASPTLTYLTVPFIKVFGLSVWSIRFANAVIGIAGIPLMYWIVKHLTNSKSAGLFGAFILAIAPFSINLSRWSIPPSVVPTFLLLFIATFFWTVTQKGWKSYIGMIFTGLSGTLLVYTYPTMKVYAPLLALIMMAVYFKKFWKQFLVGGGVFAATISPIYYLTLTQPNIYNARYNSVKLSESEGVLAGFLSRFTDYFSPLFLYGSSDGNPMHHVPRFGPIPEMVGYFIFVGIIVAIVTFVDFGYIGRWIRQQSGQDDIELGTYKPAISIDTPNNIRNMIVLLLGFLAFPIAPSFTNDKLILTRSVQGLTIAVIFLAIGYWFAMQQFRSSNIRKMLNYFVVFMCLVGCFQFSYYYFGDYSESVKGNYQYGNLEMFKYLKDNTDKFDKVEITDINMPYIYKMFWEPMKLEEYNPKTMVGGLDKYIFTNGVNKDGLKNIPIIHEIKDTKKNVWFKIYEYKPRWYIVTR